eukprot:5206905-Prymnesium_polylepis.1
MTLQIWRCKWDGDWSPCRGGYNAGGEGAGFCAEGHNGPRCEVCSGHSYFGKLDARCHGCGDVKLRTVILISAGLLLLLAWFGGTTATRLLMRGSSCDVAVRTIENTVLIWQKAGMRYKIKALIGFYQCIAAVPSVYNVVPPLGLEEYTRWIDLVELPSELENIFVPT